jgi:hypothetical protein
MYLTLSLGLIIITLLLALWGKVKPFRNKYSEFFNFYLTLVATFVGVFLAIDFTNKSEYKKEEKNVIKLLNATVMDLNNKINRAQTTYTLASIGADSLYSARDHLRNNPMQLPNLFQSIASNEIILRHLSPQGIQEFNNCADNIQSLQTTIIEGKPKEDSILVSTVKVYMKQMDFAKRIIALEVGRMEGDISDKYLDEHYSQLIYELVGIGPHDIEKAIQEQKNRAKSKK